jgi:DNA polymerase IV
MDSPVTIASPMASSSSRRRWGPSFIEALAVERFHGVGPATAAKMKKLGIFTARDLRAKDEAFLLRYFGKAGRHFYWICRSIDRRPVLPNRIRKSIGADNTLSRDLTSLDDMRAELDPLVDKVWRYCGSIGVRGRTVRLKVKFANFQVITRSRSYIAPIPDRATLASISEELLAAQFPMRKGVRLLGVSLSSLCADAGDVDPQMTPPLPTWRGCFLQVSTPAPRSPISGCRRPKNCGKNCPKRSSKCCHACTNSQ